MAKETRWGSSMPRLYIDTNIFMRFYDAHEDRLEQLAELRAKAPRLIVPEQTESEFRRNRLTVLNHTIREFAKISTVRPHRTALIVHHELFKQLESAMKSCRSLAAQLGKQLEEARNASLDPVALAFSELLELEDVLRPATTREVFNAAQKRKLLGQPPRSQDKDTIGDEVIWESLVGCTDDDLVILSRDGGFSKYEEVLREELRERTGKTLLLVTDKLSEAITALGEMPSERLLQQEIQQEKEDEWILNELKVRSKLNQVLLSSTIRDECPSCNSELSVETHVTNSGEVIAFLNCPACGYREQV